MISKAKNVDGTILFKFGPFLLTFEALVWKLDDDSCMFPVSSAGPGERGWLAEDGIGTMEGWCLLVGFLDGW